MFLLFIVTLILILFLQEAGTKSVQATAVKPENCTQFSFTSKKEGAQFKVPVVGSERKQTTSDLEETLHGVQNSSANTSNWVRRKSEETPSTTSDGPNQLDFLLDKDTIENSCRQVPLNEQGNNTASTKQRKTDFSITAPALLREKILEDGSEVIGHTTSATLSFQNSLWFELD